MKEDGASSERDAARSAVQQPDEAVAELEDQEEEIAPAVVFGAAAGAFGAGLAAGTSLDDK